MTKNKTNDELRDIITTFGWLYLSDDSPIDNSPTDLDSFTENLMTELTRNYRILPKGSEIRPGDVRPGDLVRIEYTSGFVTEFDTIGPFKDDVEGKVYLLHRPNPDDDFVFPNRHGAVIRLTPNNYTDKVSERTVASLENGYWSVVGTTATFDENDLRQRYCEFETLSDGIDK